ncbi:MAG: MBL fold metallo-hydrolase [Acutalibacteraceae bacterium]
MIRIEKFVVGPLDANCYFVFDAVQKVALVIDPGGESEALCRRIERFGAQYLKYILLTHGHFDHIGYAAALHEKYKAPIVISEEDAALTENEDLNLSKYFGVPMAPFKPNMVLFDGAELPFGQKSVRAIMTPGHTRGGCCYIIDKSLFTGDTLMKGCIGRLDFPTGDRQQMQDSLNRLKHLVGDYDVYCGHGDSTTLEKERCTNVYMGNYIYDDLY